MHGRHEVETLVRKELCGLSIALIEIACRKPAAEGAGVSTGEIADAQLEMRHMGVSTMHHRA
jgi:hypothetical protein